MIRLYSEYLGISDQDMNNGMDVINDAFVEAQVSMKEGVKV
jgi:hypothetical protein